MHTIGCFAGLQFRNETLALPQEVVRTRAYSDHFAMIDRQGIWWISTALGVFRFRKEPAADRLTSAMDSYLLPGRDVHRFYEDSRGDLWMTTIDFRSSGAKRWEYGLIRWERATGPGDGLFGLFAACRPGARDYSIRPRFR
jgi:ligand-binding sensor domain-containing protein